MLKNILLCFFVLSFFVSRAQESMLPDVSYPFLQKLIDTAKKYYPKVRSYDHQIAVEQYNVKRTQLQWFDVFTFTYLYSPNNSTTLANPSLLNGYQLGVVFSLGQLFRTPPQIRMAKENLKVVEAYKDEYLLNIEAEVKTRYFTWLENKAIVRVQTHAALDAENLMKEARYRFEKGEITFDGYNNSLITLTQVQQRILECEAGVLIAKGKIEELIGKKLEEIK